MGLGVAKATVAVLLLAIAWVLATGPQSETPPDPEDYATLVAYVQRWTGVQSPPPEAVLVDHWAWRIRHFRRCWRLWKECELQAIYTSAGPWVGRITIDADIAKHPVILRSVIVHELAHWADHMRGVDMGECIGGVPDSQKSKVETKARAAQNLWLKDQGYKATVPLEGGC